MFGSFYVKQKRKRNKGILIYPNTKKRIHKTSNVKASDFIFNADWRGSIFSRLLYYGRIEIGERSFFESGTNSIMRSGSILDIAPGAFLKFGDNVSFNNRCEVFCSNKIVIGNDTIFGPNCILRDSDCHIIEGSSSIGEIIIGDHCWFGTNVIVLKNVHIGSGSVIGAGSVVTHDIPENCLAVGNPAKVLKTNIKWKRH